MTLPKIALIFALTGAIAACSTTGSRHASLVDGGAALEDSTHGAHG